MTLPYRNYAIQKLHIFVTNYTVMKRDVNVTYNYQVRNVIAQ